MLATNRGFHVIDNFPSLDLFIDLIDHLCDAKMCPTRRGDLIMYRDNHHITATYAESFAADIETALLADVAALRGSP